TSGGNGGTSGDGGSPGSGSFTCCVNSKSYSCADDATAKKCAGIGAFDLSACLQKCNGGDPTCSNSCTQQANQSHSTPDPSVCAASAGTCSGTGTGSDSCSGANCSSDHDCATGQRCNDK